MFLIPRNSKMRRAIWRTYTVIDVLVMIGICLVVLSIIMSNIPYNYYIAIFVSSVAIVLFLEDENIRLYRQTGQVLKYLFSTKKFIKQKSATRGVGKFVPFEKILDDGTIVYKYDCYAKVMSIESIEFFLLSEYKQNSKMSLFAQLFDCLGAEQSASIVKLHRPINFDSNIAQVISKLQSEKNTYRKAILEERLAVLDVLNNQELQHRPYFYIVVYDRLKANLLSTYGQMQRYAERIGLNPKELSQKETVLFLKYGYNNQFDEREINSIDPKDYISYLTPNKLRFRPASYEIDGTTAINLAITEYPLSVDGGWFAGVMGIPCSKVVVNIKPVDKETAIKRCDNVVSEILSRDATHKASEINAEETHLQAMTTLLNDLQNGNEMLYDTSCIFTGYTDKDQLSKLRSQLRKDIRRDGFRVSSCGFRQAEAFISSNISPRVSVPWQRGINSKTLGGSFPFAYANYVDEKGIVIGENGYPVIVDFFKRGGKYTNSNTFVIGASGTGKSHLAKTIVANLFSENCTLYVLDPENEFSDLCLNLGGKVIDCGTNINGVLNPFQIYLNDSNKGADMLGQHLQFLEEFYRTVIPNIDSECFEVLNNLTVLMYEAYGITSETNTAELDACSYPTFDDLGEVVRRSRVDKSIKSKLTNYLAKFMTGGRYSSLWNSHSSLEINEDFVVFNFERLLANKNTIVANGQTLLIMKYLDEILLKFKSDGRHPILIVDEGQRLTDPKHPVALDSMNDHAKRIRHRNGGLIFLTQNIKDLTVTTEIASKSSAIINNCQYSFIFALKPIDMLDLVELYRESGSFTEIEKQEIATNDRGVAFFIPSSDARTSVRIVTANGVRSLWPDTETNSQNSASEPNTDSSSDTKNLDAENVSTATSTPDTDFADDIGQDVL